MHIKNIFKFTTLFFALLFANLVFAYGSTGLSDSAITSTVKAKITTDNSLSGTAINVATNNGIVSLSGNVGSDTQASIAIELAQSSPGVKDVETINLSVNGNNQPISDIIITAKIKGMFIQQKLFTDKDIASMSIKIETNNGIVSLSGTADNQTQVNNAIKIAESISGVKKVKSTVQISNT